MRGEKYGCLKLLANFQLLTSVIRYLFSDSRCIILLYIIWEKMVDWLILAMFTIRQSVNAAEFVGRKSLL